MASGLTGLLDSDGELYLPWQMGSRPEGPICRKNVRSGVGGEHRIGAAEGTKG